MKKFILASLVVVFSLSAFSVHAESALNQKEDAYSTKAFELLSDNIDNIDGVNAQGQQVNARAALEEAGEYIMHIFTSFTFFGDDEDYEGNVEDLNFKCQKSTAKCQLKIKFKAGDIKERQLSFKVAVDGNMPTSIVDNKILIVDKK